LLFGRLLLLRHLFRNYFGAATFASFHFIIALPFIIPSFIIVLLITTVTSCAPAPGVHTPASISLPLLVAAAFSFCRHFSSSSLFSLGPHASVPLLQLVLGPTLERQQLLKRRGRRPATVRRHRRRHLQCLRFIAHTACYQCPKLLHGTFFATRRSSCRVIVQLRPYWV